MAALAVDFEREHHAVTRFALCEIANNRSPPFAGRPSSSTVFYIDGIHSGMRQRQHASNL